MNPLTLSGGTQIEYSSDLSTPLERNADGGTNLLLQNALDWLAVPLKSFVSQSILCDQCLLFLKQALEHRSTELYLSFLHWKSS